MGGCAGKNKSKSYEPELDSNKKPQSKTKDDHVQSKPSSSPPKNLPLSNGPTVKNDNHIPNAEENGNNSDIQAVTDQSEEINRVIGQIFSSRVDSGTDSELEYELANLVYGHPENDYAENPCVATTFKSTEV